jgi:hypothetical protein
MMRQALPARRGNPSESLARAAAPVKIPARREKGVRTCSDITAPREHRLIAIFPAAPRKPLWVGGALRPARRSEASSMKVIFWILMCLIALLVLPSVVWVVIWILAASRETDWTGIHQEAGPLPLSSPAIPIVRLVDKRNTFERGLQTIVFWDEGNGPIRAEDRIKALLDSVPKEFTERMFSQKKVPAKFFPPLRDDIGVTDYPKYDATGVVVSLNPDVLIVSVRERPLPPDDHPARDWDSFSYDQSRRQYIDARIEHIRGGRALTLYAGTLIPWSNEMHVFSTDPKIKNGPLNFDNKRAEVTLPVGKLVLVHHNEDVDVTRQ